MVGNKERGAGYGGWYGGGKGREGKEGEGGMRREAHVRGVVMFEEGLGRKGGVKKQSGGKVNKDRGRGWGLKASAS